MSTEFHYIDANGKKQDRAIHDYILDNGDEAAALSVTWLRLTEQGWSERDIELFLGNEIISDNGVVVDTAFDPALHPRVETGEHAGEFTVSSAAHLLDMYRDANANADDIIAEFSDAKEKIETAERKIANGVESNELVDAGGHMQADGTYTPARQALHMRIIEQLLNEKAVKAATPDKGERPTATFLGGRGGSGKGWFTESQGPVDKHKAIYINSDDIKEMLPEYEGWNAALVHEEAGDIVTQAEHMCIELGLNVIHDGTMRTAASTVRRVREYKNAGYRVEGFYMFVPPQIAARRALDRFLHKGRYVPVSYTLGSLSNERTFDALKSQFDKWALYQNMGKAPALVAQHG